MLFKLFAKIQIMTGTLCPNTSAIAIPHMSEKFPICGMWLSQTQEELGKSPSAANTPVHWNR